MPSANAAEFSAKVDDVFARIAGRYDVLCDLFSLGIHRLWKRRMVARMKEHPGRVLLDVASGTGDIPSRLLERGMGAGRSLLVTDLCPQMLAMAERKLVGRGGDVRLAQCNAEELSDIPNGSIDLYSISFGMKICDRAKVITEAYRVLKPGGTFFCLEAARIPVAFVHAIYLKYMNLSLPIIGRIATDGDASAYGYLLRGVHEFPEQRAFCAELEDAGFRNVRYENLTFGIVALHEATKSA